MIYIELFLSFFKIGLFTIGGGYAAMPLIQSQIVDLHGWLTMNQFADIITIAEMTPGPIAINSATFVGLQVAGIQGAIISTIGCVTPSCVIVLILAYIYFRYRGLNMIQGVLSGFRPAIIAIIASAGLSLLIMAIYGDRVIPGNPLTFDKIALFIFVVDLIVLKLWKINPIWIMGCSGIASIILYSLI